MPLPVPVPLPDPAGRSEPPSPEPPSPSTGAAARRPQLFFLMLLGVVLVLVSLVAATTEAFDPDVFWMAAAGRELLADGALLRTNLFSFTAPDHAWVMHEWLLGPLYAVGLERFGPPFLNGLTLLAVFAIAGLMWLGTVGRAARPLAGTVAALFSLTLLALHNLSPRPTVLARLFPLALTLLAFGPRFTWRHAALAVLVELVWANAHGSFPLGVVLLAAAALAGDPGQRRLRWGTALAAAVATGVTPHGLALHGLVVGYVGGADPTLALVRQRIIEFGPLWSALGRGDLWPEALGLLALAALAVAAWTARRDRVRAALSLALVTMAVLQQRHASLALLLGTLLLLPELERRLPRRWPDHGALRPRVAFAVALGPAVVLATAALANTASTRPADAWFSPSLGGSELGRLVAAVPDDAHVYTGFQTAGRLIWHSSRRGVRVFYDSRNDCYPLDVATDHFLLGLPSIDPAQARAILARRAVEHALVGPDDPVSGILATDPEWRVAAEEGTWRLYTRRP